MKTIAVLLTVFNRKQQTIKCLSELFSQKLPEDTSLDVFLTNDGCTDGTPDAVRELFPSVYIINGDGDLFWNRGMWTAWNAASKKNEYDFYLWLNDDTFLINSALDILLDSSEEKANESIIVGACKSTINSETTYGGYVKNKRLSPNGNLQHIDYFNGNIVLVPSYVFNRVGNLDYYYRHSHGDTDYGKRASMHGIESFITKSFVGICDRHASLSKWCNPDIPLLVRMKSLYSPTGYNPKEVFHYEKRHNGYIVACFHILTIYLRLLFPSIWTIIGHKDKA